MWKIILSNIKENDPSENQLEMPQTHLIRILQAMLTTCNEIYK